MNLGFVIKLLYSLSCTSLESRVSPVSSSLSWLLWLWNTLHVKCNPWTCTCTMHMCVVYPSIYFQLLLCLTSFVASSWTNCLLLVSLLHVSENCLFSQASISHVQSWMMRLLQMNHSWRKFPAYGVHTLVVAHPGDPGTVSNSKWAPSPLGPFGLKKMRYFSLIWKLCSW